MITDKNLFFVLGYQKSGTTWVATLLNAHPDIYCDGEGHFHRGDDTRQYLPDAIASSPQLRDWASAHSNLWLSGSDFEREAEFLAAAITRSIMFRAAANSGKCLVGDKSGLVGPRTVASINRMFPEARILHLVRDPRDVAVSKCFHLWRGVNDGGYELPPEQETIRRTYQLNPEQFGPDGRSIFHPDFLRAFAEEWSMWVVGCRDLAETLFRERYFELRYEALNADPFRTLKSTLVFLGASVQTEVVETCVNVASFKNQSGRLPGELEPLSYFRRGIVGDWHNFFTPPDLEILEKHGRAGLERMEYSVATSA